jgi:hypothetical protein
MLRCNFIMRGVALAGGPHTVELTFQPRYLVPFVDRWGIRIPTMATSLAAIGLGLLLLLMLFVSGRSETTEPANGRKK